MRRRIWLLIVLVAFLSWNTSAIAVDTKVTGLTADTSPTSDDLVVTVNAPGSSPANRKVTLANLFGLYLNMGGCSDSLVLTWDNDTTKFVCVPVTIDSSGVIAGAIGITVSGGSDAVSSAFKTYSSQTGDSFQVQDSAGSPLVGFGAEKKGAVTLKESTNPSTPASGYMKLYVKSDGKMYTKSSAGTETEIGSSASEVGTIEEGKWCYGSGGVVVCDQDEPGTGEGTVTITGETLTDQVALFAGDNGTVIKGGSYPFNFTGAADKKILSYDGATSKFLPSDELILSSLVIPNADDPDVTVSGQISYDTDGWFRHYSGSLIAQVGTPEKQTIQVAIQDPENIKTHAGRSTKSQVIWANITGMSFKITRVYAISDTDDYTFKLFHSASLTDIGTANDTELDTATFACSSNGTGGYYVDRTSGFEDDTVETGKYLIFEHSSGTAESLHIVVEGYFLGDVN